MPRFQYFTADELACRCGECDFIGEDEMDARFMRRIVDLRKKLDFPFVVTSAFRCPKYNAKVSKTGLDGPHTTGRAIDLKIFGYRAFKLLSLAGQYGMTGIGVSQRGEHAKRFLHLDDLDEGEGRPRPWPWSY